MVRLIRLIDPVLLRKTPHEGNSCQVGHGVRGGGGGGWMDGRKRGGWGVGGARGRLSGLSIYGSAGQLKGRTVGRLTGWSVDWFDYRSAG